MVELTYGAGLRLLECCRLRVKDVDFGRRQLIVREGKGNKDRAVPLPDRCGDSLRIQIVPGTFVHFAWALAPVFSHQPWLTPKRRILELSWDKALER